MDDTSPRALVLRLLDAFPEDLCTGAESSSAIAAHLASPEFRTAPQRGRTAAAALHACANVAALDDGLDALHAGLCARAPGPNTPEPTIPQLRLLRMLFVGAVMLLSAGIRAPSKHALAALEDLARLALGAVALPQLAALERTLLAQVDLPPLLLALLDETAPAQAAPRVSEARGARWSLALRWAASALSTPALAPQLWPAVPQLLACAVRLRGPAGGAYACACTSVTCAALCGMRVEVPSELVLAQGVVHSLQSHAESLLSASPAPGRSDGCEARGCGGALHVLRSVGEAGGVEEEWEVARAQLESVCTVLFGLLAEAHPRVLTPALLDACRDVAIAAAVSVPAASCGADAPLDAPQCVPLGATVCAWLRDMVTLVPAGERKQHLVGWMLALRGEVQEAEGRAMRTRATCAPRSLQSCHEPEPEQHASL